MVPLSELPINHIGSDALPGQPQELVQDGKLHTATPNGDEASDILLNPSSIQSMLRNTTETGNVGQFSIKPSRVPTSLPRPLASKARATPSKQHHIGAKYTLFDESNSQQAPAHQRQPTTISSSSGYQTQYHRGPLRAPSSEDYKSYSMIKTSHTSHILTNRYPHVQDTYGSREGSHSQRPRSPFAYPTRLKRPGYRPSSPAFSESNKHGRGQSTSLYRRPSFRTASPSSIHTTNGAPSPWRKGINRSDPMLRFYPHSAATLSNGVGIPSPSSTRPPTPKLSPSLKSMASSSNAFPAEQPANCSWTSPQSPPPSPMFYDYTEAFEEQDSSYTHQISMSTGTLAEHPLPETATTTYFELDESSDNTGPSDMRSEYDHPKKASPTLDIVSDPDTLQLEGNNQSSMHALHRDLSEVPELPEGDTKEFSFDEADMEAANHGSNGSLHNMDSPVEMISPSVVAKEQSMQSPAQECNHRSPRSFQRSFSHLEPSPLPYQCLALPINSVLSAESVPQPEGRDPSLESAGIPKNAAASQLQLELLSAEDHESITDSEKTRHSLQPQRATSFDEHSGIEHTEIISPTPERSLMSPSNRNRFSRILSIDEGLLESDQVSIQLDGNDSKTNSKKHVNLDSCAHPTINASRLRKRSLRPRDSPVRQNIDDYALVEMSDSNDEPELTQGLRQAFCKPDEQLIGVRNRSPPITLKSPSVHGGCPAPMTIRRSPAMRRSAVKLPKLSDPTGVLTEHEPESPERLSDGIASIIESVIPSPVDKELPSQPHERPAVVSFPPPLAPRLPSLPFSFTPLIQRRSEDDSALDLEIARASSYLFQEEKPLESGESQVPKPQTNAVLDRSSFTSSPNSRPWNIDANYPWSDQLPKLEVTMPVPFDNSVQPTDSPPRFRFRVHRASTSTSPFASPHDLFLGPSFRQKRDTKLSVLPGQINSSHDIIQSSPMQTRFVSSFETQSPTITLLPPSPGYEVRSFFSDDSSQIQPKGSLRKRFSALKARTSRGGSTDEIRGYDRGLLGSALGRSRASGRSSRQSQNTARASSYVSKFKHVRWRFVGKFRSWWHRGEDRVRDWRWRRRYSEPRSRSASADLYAGV